MSSTLLISFCNADVPNFVLGLLDTTTGHFQWIDIGQAKPTTGALGITSLESTLFVALAYADGTSGVVALDSKLNVTFERQLEISRDVHSIMVRERELWMVDTAHNRITAIEFDLDHGFSGEERAVWVCGNTDFDRVHLNSIAEHDGRVLVSGFGEREESWLFADNGFVIDIESNATQVRGLLHPHSLVSANGFDYVLESRTGTLWKLNDLSRLAVQKVRGYARGLVINEDFTAIATSAARKRSKSTGTINVPPDGKGLDFEARLHLLSNGVRREFVLSGFGSEVFDLFPLTTDALHPTANTTLQALADRIYGYQEQMSIATTKAKEEIGRRQEAETEIARLSEELGREQERVRLLGQATEAAKHESDLFQRRHQEAESEIARLSDETRAARETLELELLAARQQVEDRQAAIAAIHNSTAWRLGSPFRLLGDRHPRLRRFVRNVLRVAWRTLTFRLRKNSQPLQDTARPVLSPILWGNLEFREVEAPTVSVIIPVYQGEYDLANCLRSLASNQDTEPPFEVILVEDCPTHPVTGKVPPSAGLFTVVNDTNLGFLYSCNRGAKSARGRYLCFLNSDTIVAPGWLRTLVEASEEVDHAGLVGGMLLNTNGTIQSAGWRILKNGWGLSIGVGQDPRDGRFTYRRVVDCVTGACFVVPQVLFKQLGGFDPLFAPAFYEEFDLAFRAKKLGFHTVYEPRSVVTHVGSSSYGAERRDELATLNHAKFIKRFAEELSRQPDGTESEFVLRHTDRVPAVLVIDDGVPHVDRHAGAVTMTKYLSLMREMGWRVIFGPFDGVANGPAAEGLERQGIEIIRNPKSIERWLVDNGQHIDRVWVARPEIATRLLPVVRSRTTAKVVYYTHDLHHLRLEREAALPGNTGTSTEAMRVKLQETMIFRSVDYVISPSEAEAKVIRQLAPRTPTTAIPPYFYDEGEVRAYDAAHFQGLSDIVFVGGFPHLPNVDAALFVAREVMPLVWVQEPNARLILVGYAPPPEVLALAGPRILVTGQVPLIEPVLSAARMSIATLRYGAGVKGKVVESLKCGVPVVSTAVGAEGIPIQPGLHAITAEEPETIAKAMVSLLRDAERCARLSRAGADLVREHYTRSAAKDALLESLRMGEEETVRLSPSHLNYPFGEIR